MPTVKKRILLEIILSILVILFTITLIIIIILIRVYRPNLRSQNTIDDISIIGLESFDFIEEKTIPEYPYDNLGNTGKLILDCYTGTCIHQIPHKYSYNTNCDSKGFCQSDEYTVIEHRPIIDHNCSEQCHETGKTECYCSEPYDEIGTCKNKMDDRYEKGKVCYAHNTIYFWKGKRYDIGKSINYAYIKDAILKDEGCPKGTKNCGIIDNNGNQLCIRNHLNCPINYISENISRNDYSSVLIGNKTFYYGNDNTTKRKIIAGFVADTDLLLNQDNDKTDIIDNYTISGFLKDNQNLYKNVNLGYDPYQEENIDSKGKSHLRIFYNEENVNLTFLREISEKINFNHRMNNVALNSIHYKTKVITILGLIALGFLLLVFIIILCNQFSYYKRVRYGGCNKCYYACVIIIFIGLMITPLIFGCINITKAKDAQNLDINKDYSTFKKLNIAFIIIGFTLFLFLIVYIIFVPIKFGFKEKVSEKVKNKISESWSSTVYNTN